MRNKILKEKEWNAFLCNFSRKSEVHVSLNIFFSSQYFWPKIDLVGDQYHRMLCLKNGYDIINILAPTYFTKNFEYITKYGENAKEC